MEAKGKDLFTLFESTIMIVMQCTKKQIEFKQLNGISYKSRTHP